jgi:hypothetical protein
MKKILFATLALGFFNIKAQELTKTNPLTFSGYAETYCSYDLSQPESHERPSFFYSYNRHNEVNLNLGFVKANYTTEKVRGNFALIGGTYAQYNLAAEQGLLKNIFESNVGVKISNKKNIWIDAGIMPSHIGFESAIGKDCWNLTRSILAENSPYYESGIKLSYTSTNEKLYLAAIQLTEKLGITAGFDIGMQQVTKDTSEYNVWYSPVLIVQYKPTSKIRIAARGEYYSDKYGVIIATNTVNGFQTLGYSINFDYLPTDHVMFRIEGRGLSSKDQIFLLDNKPNNANYFLTSSLAIAF